VRLARMRMRTGGWRRILFISAGPTLFTGPKRNHCRVSLRFPVQNVTIAEFHLGCVWLRSQLGWNSSIPIFENGAVPFYVW
jgi:hypothetical protein